MKEKSKETEKSTQKGYVDFYNYQIWKEQGKPKKLLDIVPKGAFFCTVEEMERALDREKNWPVSWRPEPPHYCQIEF
jgi:hypothetical protein